ncbi:MAG: hypothetical protein ACKOEQ_09315, partial [Verrucomicrobiota bacterium]
MPSSHQDGPCIEVLAMEACEPCDRSRMDGDAAEDLFSGAIAPLTLLCGRDADAEPAEAGVGPLDRPLASRAVGLLAVEAVEPAVVLMDPGQGSRSRGAALAGEAPMLSVGLPSQMEVLAFKLTPLNFGASVLSATGPTMEARLTFSGVALSWLGDAAVKDASGNALAAGSGTTVTLVGTPAAINDYLANGALGATTTADATLGVSVAYGGGSASSGSISLKSVNPLVNVTGLGDLLDHLPNGWTSKRSDQAYSEFFPGSLTNYWVSRADNYSQEGTGWLKTQRSGIYYFYAVADDVVKFQVFDDQNSVLAVALDPNGSDNTAVNGSNAWGANQVAGLRKSAPVYLEAGRYYRFKLDYTEGTGGDAFDVGYTMSASNPAGVYVTQVTASSENYPPLVSSSNDEKVSNALDGTNAKYMNLDEFGDRTTGRDSGLMVRLSEAVSLSSIQFRSAADNDVWDPTSYALYGSNVPLPWSSSAWGSALSTGNTNLATARGTNGALVPVNGAQAFQYYKVVFPTTRGNSSGQYFMHVGEVYLGYGTVSGGANSAVVASAPGSENNTPSLVTANGHVFGMVPDFAGTQVTVTLSATGSGQLAVMNNGVPVGAGGAVGGVTVEGVGTTTLRLAGTVANLRSVLATPGAIQNSLSLAGSTLSLRLAYGGQVAPLLGSNNNAVTLTDYLGPGATLPGTVSTITASPGGSPAGDVVANLQDGWTNTKYLNYGGAGAGFAVTMGSATVLDSMLLVTRTNDDIAKWDPATWQVYGSNTSGGWSDSNWTLLGSGNTNLGPQRGALSVVSFANATAYLYYKVVFPTTRG